MRKKLPTRKQQVIEAYQSLSEIDGTHDEELEAYETFLCEITEIYPMVSLNQIEAIYQNAPDVESLAGHLEKVFHTWRKKNAH